MSQKEQNDELVVICELTGGTEDNCQHGHSSNGYISVLCQCSPRSKIATDRQRRILPFKQRSVLFKTPEWDLAFVTAVTSRIIKLKELIR